jgi:hypothetical protein
LGLKDILIDIKNNDLYDERILKQIDGFELLLKNNMDINESLDSPEKITKLIELKIQNPEILSSFENILTYIYISIKDGKKKKDE